MTYTLLKNTAIYGLGAIFTKALGFFLIPIYTRYFSVEEYGILSLLNVMLQLISFVFLLGVSSAAMRFYFNTGADANYRRQLYGTATILLFILPSILFVALGPLIYILVNLYLPSIPFFPYVFIIVILGLLTPIEKLMTGLLRVQQRAKIFVMYYFSFFLVQATVIIIAVAYLGYGLKGQLYAQVIANLIFWTIALYILRKNSTFSFSWELSKKLLNYGVFLIPFFIFSWISNASGRFMLERFCSLKEVGIFALAVQFSGLVRLFGEAFDNALMPFFYETAQKVNGSQMLGKFATQFVVFIGLIGLVTLIVAQPMVLIMADSKFHEALHYIPMIILCGCLAIGYKFSHWSLMYSKKTRTISMITALNAIFMIGSLFLFLRQWGMGIQGVVIAMFTINVFLIIVGYIISQKYYHIHYNVLEIGALAAVAFISAAGIIFFQKKDLNVINYTFQLIFFLGAFILMCKIANINVSIVRKFLDSLYPSMKK